MFSSNDCLPTPLFPRPKTNFLDLSDSSSISSGTGISRTNSLQEISSPDFITKSSLQTPIATTNLLDLPLIKVTEVFQTSDDPQDSLFPEDLYDRVDEYLDQEGLFLSTPSPFPKPRRSKQSMTVVLSTSFLSKSEASTAIDGDSPFSDTQGLTGPAFLIRRTISGGFKPNSLSLLMSQMKSEPGADCAQTPFTANCTTKLQTKNLRDICGEEVNEIDSME